MQENPPKQNESEQELPASQRQDEQPEAQGLADEQIWEQETRAAFGPPMVRARKQRRYINRLLRKHSEASIRGMLRALAELDRPRCCENLRRHDLERAPLDSIIQPYELLGLNFKVLKASKQQVTVDIGESYHCVGSGGCFYLKREGEDRFIVSGRGEEWIA